MLSKFRERILGAIFDAGCGAIYGFIITWWLMRYNGGVLDWSPVKTCAVAFAAFGFVFGSAVVDLFAAMAWVLSGFSRGESRDCATQRLLKEDEHTPSLFRALFALALTLGLWFHHTHGHPPYPF